MKTKYKLNLLPQIISGIIGAVTTVAVTYPFDHKIKWALAITIGIGIFIVSGFYDTE